MIFPVPPQREQVSWLCIMPKGVREVRSTTPLPRQSGQTSGVVPASQPVPWQVSHGSTFCTSSSLLQPKAASLKSTDTLARTLARTLTDRPRLLRLLSMNLYDMEANSRPEQLAELQSLLASGDNNTGHKGLFNVQRRVQLLYGEKYGLKIACPPEGGTEIRVLLPLH